MEATFKAAPECVTFVCFRCDGSPALENVQFRLIGETLLNEVL